ncbi:uncharacterized protein LOC120575301 [Perca fluviatilis]|uniref:uncharacterized protein LOC120575301 n=1 Tax=Perca fluviatilis TaxID=8168 RepID=UPI001963A2CE|nr:uncharacterized protein LOC120575301 [Perca fluviatilis]
MIQVPTQAGGIGLVYRAWTELDIKQATSHLPPCKNSGTQFTIALQAFIETFLPTVPEIRRLLMVNLGPMEYAKIRHLLPEDPTDDPVLLHPNLANRANDGYNDLLDELSTGLETVFPDRIDMTRVTNTKQYKSETVEDFQHRLSETFDRHNGIARTTAAGAVVELWEAHFKNVFLSGLLPDIRAEVDKTCIGLPDSALVEIVRHARHAEKILTSTREKTEKKRQQNSDAAQLTLIKTVAAMSQERRNAGRGKGRGRPSGRGRGKGRGSRGRGRGTYLDGGQRHLLQLWRKGIGPTNVPTPRRTRPRDSATTPSSLQIDRRWGMERWVE